MDQLGYQLPVCKNAVNPHLQSKNPTALDLSVLLGKYNVSIAESVHHTHNNLRDSC